MKRTVGYMLVLAAACGFSLHAQQSDTPPPDAGNFVKRNIDAVLLVLRDAERSADDKRVTVLKMLDPAFDFTLMAKLSLGRHHWSAFTDAQRDEFIHLFVTQLQRTYYDKLEQHADRDILYGQAEEKGNRAEVDTRVVTQDGDFVIIYRLRRTDTGWMVYDVEIQGVSVISSYRSQFNDFLSSGSVEELLAEMRAKIEDTEEAGS